MTETARSLHCPSLGRSGEGLPWPRHHCHQPAAPRAALAITPRAAGEAGQKQPLRLRPYKAQVTSLLGSRNKAKPPQPPARLSGLERSDECSPAAGTLLPADSRGSGWGPGRRSCLQLLEPQPQLPSLLLQVTTDPPNPTTIHCRSAGGTSPVSRPLHLPPKRAAAETFPVLFLQD